MNKREKLENELDELVMREAEIEQSLINIRDEMDRIELELEDLDDKDSSTSSLNQDVKVTKW